MSSMSNVERNQVRSPDIKFRVFSQNNGECKHEFQIKLKDITWDSFLKNLFGSRTFEEHQLPTIVLLGDKHKIVLRHSNIKQLIRDAVEESYRRSYVNLLIPEFESILSIASEGAAQSVPSDDDIRRTKTEISDFIDIFSKKIDLPAMDQFVQSTPHVRFLREDKDETARVELPVRENIPQLGELQVKRLNDGDLINLLKDGANLILKTSDNKFVSLKFYNDQLPTFNETQCAYRNLNLAYECSYLNVPVLVDDEIKFLFKRDAEFIQQMSKTMEAAEKTHREQIIRLRKMKKFHQETMKRIKTVKELSSADPASASTSGLTPVATSTAPAEAFIPLPNTPSTTATAAEPPVPPISESSSNEGAQPQGTSRAIRRAHRSALHRKNKRCVTAAALANAGVLIPSAETQHDALPVYANLTHLQRTCNNLTNAFQNLHVSNPARHNMGCYNMNLWQQSMKSESNPAVNTNARQETNRENSPAIGEILEKFKTEVLKDVKALIKDVWDTSKQASSTSDAKTSRVSQHDEDRHLYKALDGSHFSVGKYKPHDRQHHGSGSSKKKSTSLCPTAPLSSQEKTIEIGNGLFVTSKSGFKVRMPRNASLTIQLLVWKSAGCRIYLPSTNLRLQLGGTNSIECCVTLAKLPFHIRTMAVQVHHDIRIKSKDKSGRFRLYFNVTNGSAIIGRSFKIDVRVKKDFTMPFGSIDGAFNYENELIAVTLEKAAMATSTPEATVEEQNSQAPKSNEEVSATAAAELPDEGIGGNQEDDFSPTSDSEYSDVPDMLAKDEGIGRCYRSLMDDAPKQTMPVAGLQTDGDSDSDTDSSISFLMDENEARDVLDDSLDVVQLPSCFIPNAELTDDVLAVRIKRKNSTKRTSVEKESSDSQQSVEPSAFDTNKLTPVVVPVSADNDVKVQATTSAATSIPAQCMPILYATEAIKARTASNSTPAVTVSDDEEDEDVEFLNESIKSAAADHAYHRSVYPNLQGLKESVRPTVDANVAPKPSTSFATEPPKTYASFEPPPPFATKSSSTNAACSLPPPPVFTTKPGAFEQPAFTFEPRTPPCSTPSYTPILPEKLFEMWKSAAVPIPKQVHETVSSVFSSVSNEINNAANAARTAAASAAAAAANIVPNVPMPPSPTAPPAWSTAGQDSSNVASEAARPAANCEPSASGAQEARSSHSQPPEEKRSKNVRFSPEERSAQSSPFEFGQTGNQTDNATQIDSMYRNLSEQMQSNLITLHDMGFTDDPYIIYLLEQFPNDLSKVIESLINYSTY